ncbi:hypothetical protein D0Z03_001115 [Geotrichum reessii]|nr:hypothetical protein D0Z03_001115 [Galactomyces reessii]
MRSNLRRFLGPRNFKGFHLKNPFFFSPANKTTNYISQYSIRGDTRDSKGVNWQKVFENRSPANREVNHLTPFATNPHTKTALAVPGAIKARIYEDISVNKISPQETSFKYGISVPRVEAIIELETIRRKWQSENLITPSLKRLSSTILGMVPQINFNRNSQDGKPPVTDNLTEIPMPNETRTQRFISIAESEPFGPVDAADVLGIQPASKLLEQITSVDIIHHKDPAHEKKKADAFIAPQLEGEKAVFKFTSAKVGKVGFRYGSARDDQKHNRKVKFNSVGQMKYA